MSANVLASAASAPRSVCLVCTARDRGAPLCDECIVALADAVPPTRDNDVESSHDRITVRVAVARALQLSREFVNEPRARGVKVRR